MKSIVALLVIPAVSFFASGSQMQSLEQRVTALENRPITFPVHACGKSDSGLYLGVTPLYWKVSEDGLAYCETGSFTLVPELDTSLAILPPSFYRLDLGNGNTRSPNFHWDWGFRVALGYTTPFDGWDVLSGWTRFFNEASDSVQRAGNANINSLAQVGGAGDFVSPFWVAQIFSSPGLMNRASADWSLHLNLLDLSLGRQFLVSRHLSLKPFIGLRNGWIHQKYDLQFTALNFDDTVGPVGEPGRLISIDMKNHFWGIGARAGLNTQWFLGRGLSLFGNAAFSLLTGHFNAHYRLRDQNVFVTQEVIFSLGGAPFTQQIPAYDDTFSNVNRTHTNATMAELGIGLRWDSSFSKGKYCFSIWAGYEQNIFFAQNQFMNYQSDFVLFVANFAGPLQNGQGYPFFSTDGGNITTSGLSGGVEFSF